MRKTGSQLAARADDLAASARKGFAENGQYGTTAHLWVQGFPIVLAGRAIPYLAWLLKEIFISSLKVAGVIVSRNLPVSPIIFHAPAAQKSDLGRNIFANSITLTPGTLSLEIEGDDRHILVHALCGDMGWGEESCEMDARVARLEGG